MFSPQIKTNRFFIHRKSPGFAPYLINRTFVVFQPGVPFPFTAPFSKTYAQVGLNPAALLFTPKEAKRPKHPVMTVPEVGRALQALAIRERLIAKFAIIGGMRPGEIFLAPRARSQRKTDYSYYLN